MLAHDGCVVSFGLSSHGGKKYAKGALRFFPVRDLRPLWCQTYGVYLFPCSSKKMVYTITLFSYVTLGSGLQSVFAQAR